MDITGIGAAATAAQKVLSMIFPDKTAEEQSKLAAALALVQAQTDIDKAEAQSSDPLQHWRGGLGWVCTFGYAWNFVLQPMTVMISKLCGATVAVVPLDIGPLSVLTVGMLGLGGMHVYQQVNQ